MDELTRRRLSRRQWPRLSVLINFELRDLLYEWMDRYQVPATRLVNLAFGMLKFLIDSQDGDWILMRVNKKTGAREQFEVPRPR